MKSHLSRIWAKRVTLLAALCVVGGVLSAAADETASVKTEASLQRSGREPTAVEALEIESRRISSEIAVVRAMARRSSQEAVDLENKMREKRAELARYINELPSVKGMQLERVAMVAKIRKLVLEKNKTTAGTETTVDKDRVAAIDAEIALLSQKQAVLLKDIARIRTAATKDDPGVLLRMNELRNLRKEVTEVISNLPAVRELETKRAGLDKKRKELKAAATNVSTEK